jgi:hypothetical protein
MEGWFKTKHFFHQMLANIVQQITSHNHSAIGCEISNVYLLIPMMSDLSSTRLFGSACFCSILRLVRVGPDILVNVCIRETGIFA